MAKPATRVIHVKDAPKDPALWGLRHVWIERDYMNSERGRFGNPYPPEAAVPRMVNLELYRQYLAERLLTDVWFRNEVLHLAGKVLVGVWSPAESHAQFLAEAADALDAQAETILTVANALVPYSQWRQEEAERRAKRAKEEAAERQRIREGHEKLVKAGVQGMDGYTAVLKWRAKYPLVDKKEKFRVHDRYGGA